MAGPILVIPNPWSTDPSAVLEAPSREHLLGTDRLGRDVLSRLLHGGKNTLLMATSATFLTVFVGTTLAIFSVATGPIGNYAGLLVLNVLQSIPGLLIGLILVAVFEQSLHHLALAIGLSNVGSYALFARSTLRSLFDREYVVAAQSIGAHPLRIIIFHVLRVSLPSLVSYGGVIFSYSVLGGTTFGFLGLIGDPSIPEWGAMLAEGRTVLWQAPWISIIPMILISSLVLTVNLLADTLLRT